MHFIVLIITIIKNKLKKKKNQGPLVVVVGVIRLLGFKSVQMSCPQNATPEIITYEGFLGFAFSEYKYFRVVICFTPTLAQGTLIRRGTQKRTGGINGAEAREAKSEQESGADPRNWKVLSFKDVP